MNYKRMEQCSKIYKYGRDEEFETKKEANDAIEKLKQQIITELALEKLYDKSDVEIVEVENGFKLNVEIKIPQLFIRS